MNFSATSPAENRPAKLFRRYQIRALLLTYLAYSSFHISRKPLSIIKTLLSPDPPNSSSSSSSGWPPFNESRGPHRLGELDLAFLSSYSAGMYFSGHLADRLNLRLLLAAGMLASSLATAAFGLAYWLNIHRLSLFLLVQFAGGFAQSVGWPCVVAVVTNWFGDSSRRGLVMGAWSSHASVGNAVGSVLAALVLGFGWGWSFVLPALVLGFAGVLVLALLVSHPRELGTGDRGFGVEMSGGNSLNEKDLVVREETGLLLARLEEEDEEEEEAIGFFAAWRLPGVAPYACCLFFSKLVAYTFLYWLPFYIRHTGMPFVILAIVFAV